MSAIALIGSVASAAIGSSQQQSLINQQNDANAQWASYQRQQAQEQNARDAVNRQKADAARINATNQVTADQQKTAQQTEQDRLTQTITPTDLQQPPPGQTPDLVGDKLLSGQKGAAPEVQQSITDQITNASQQARQRIAALATIQSYGGSQFGLQNRAQTIFNNSGQDIREFGDFRQGDLAAYSAAKAVPVRQFAATPSAASGIASSLAGIAAKGLTG
jgi:hypothetical protein